MKRIFLFVLTNIAVVVVLALAGGGYYYWQEAQKVESTDDAEIDGSIVSVSPRVAGHVKEVLVEDQQLVHAGDVLVRLDTQDFELAIARAKAEVSGAAAGLEVGRPVQLDRRRSGFHPHAERRFLARSDPVLRPHRARR